jgi:hypothetical protein
VAQRPSDPRLLAAKHLLSTLRDGGVTAVNATIAIWDDYESTLKTITRYLKWFDEFEELIRLVFEQGVLSSAGNFFSDLCSKLFQSFRLSKFVKPYSKLLLMFLFSNKRTYYCEVFIPFDGLQ